MPALARPTLESGVDIFVRAAAEGGTRKVIGSLMPWLREMRAHAKAGRHDDLVAVLDEGARGWRKYGARDLDEAWYLRQGLSSPTWSEDWLSAIRAERFPPVTEDATAWFEVLRAARSRLAELDAVDMVGRVVPHWRDASSFPVAIVERAALAPAAMTFDLPDDIYLEAARAGGLADVTEGSTWLAHQRDADPRSTVPSALDAIHPAWRILTAQEFDADSLGTGAPLSAETAALIRDISGGLVTHWDRARVPTWTSKPDALDDALWAAAVRERNDMIAARQQRIDANRQAREEARRVEATRRANEAPSGHLMDALAIRTARSERREAERAALIEQRERRRADRAAAIERLAKAREERELARQAASATAAERRAEARRQRQLDREAWKLESARRRVERVQMTRELEAQAFLEERERIDALLAGTEETRRPHGNAMPLGAATLLGELDDRMLVAASRGELRITPGAAEWLDERQWLAERRVLPALARRVYGTYLVAWTTGSLRSIDLHLKPRDLDTLDHIGPLAALAEVGAIATHPDAAAILGRLRRLRLRIEDQAPFAILDDAVPSWVYARNTPEKLDAMWAERENAAIERITEAATPDTSRDADRDEAVLGGLEAGHVQIDDPSFLAWIDGVLDAEDEGGSVAWIVGRLDIAYPDWRLL